MENIRAYLEPIADWFGRLGVPEPIVQWGHPVMMGIVVFVLGSFVAWAGWQGRINPDGEVAMERRSAHALLAPFMYIFVILGSTGGVLSLVMQGEPIFGSYHFVTGIVVLALLTLNATIALFGFPGNKKALRTVHAYVGSIAILLLFVHAFLGLQLGLSI
jgi:magnesium-transporting ATPase (P-type)